MATLRRWLEDQGLGHYAEAFADNDIDLEILPELGDQDLKDLGLSLGHRKKLLKAIAALAVTAPSPAPRAEAERRQLTVMFADLVGSTALSSRLDPEDMREVIRSYQDACAGVITRFEGFVAKYMGDGVLAYFGYPRAHEDDAERAVRAGLALTETVAKLEGAGDSLSARIGIATGLVVVGDLVGEGASQEQAVVGDTPNLAARLQEVAEPGQVVIAQATRRLLGARFDLVDLGMQSLKGLTEPVEAFAVSGKRVIESRFEAHGGQVLPMVGRDHELALLLERWARAKAGEGQGVLLVGEAGIGKSRITRALLDALADEPHTRIRYQCSPYHTDSALWPVIQQLGHAAGFIPEDSLETRLDKLEALLDRADGRKSAPLIANLLGLDAVARYGKLDLTPQIQRARTLEALVDQLVGLAAKEPVLMILEDAHWVDPTTLELIEQCLDRISDRRVLTLLTSRPDNQPKLAGHPHATRLSLNRLGHAGVEAIVKRLGGDHLPSATIDAIITRTDGVPLFVEELTKTILETGETAIPASLHDSLMARLDWIAEVKELAQIAACIGREFAYPLLSAVADRSEQELRRSLDKLADAELVFRRGTPPDARYSFKHALLQDAAYESLLRSRRRQVHARIARALEEGFAGAVETEPEVLAHHHGLAGQTETAFCYRFEAGRRAAERSANLEAIEHLVRARDDLATFPDGPERDQHELELLITLGPALSATRGFAAAEVERVYGRVRELCRMSGDADQARAALQALRVLYMARGDLAAAENLGQELLTVGQRQASLSHQFDGHLALGIVDEVRAHVSSARRHLEQALGALDQIRFETSVRQPLGSPEVTCRGHLANVLFLAGLIEQSKARSSEAIEIARVSSHPFSVAQALGSTSLANFLGRPVLDARNAVELVILAKEHGFAFWHAQGLAFRGWANIDQGRTQQGLLDLRQAIAEAEAMGAPLIKVFALTALATTLGRQGDAREALPLLTEQRRLARTTGIAMFDVPARLCEGELRMKLTEPDPATAEACFQDALDIARRQEARILELRAAMALAHLWQDQGKRTDARDLLAPIYAWFTEGFDTPDLIDARALLAEFGAPDG